MGNKIFEGDSLTRGDFSVDPESLERYNSLSAWYRRRVEKNPAMKEKIVHCDPHLAQYLFYVFHDREIGGLFVSKYAEDPHLHHSAYFISLELGTPLQRREEPAAPERRFLSREMSDFLQELHREQSLALRADLSHPHKKSDEPEPSWDNTVRLYEEPPEQ